MADLLTSAGRSYLYVPADRRDQLEGALSRNADALILDLEDAVSLKSKEAARATVAEWLVARPAPSCPLWVRINSTSLDVDIAAAVTTAVTGVVVPKAQPDMLDEVDRLLSEREQQLGLAAGMVHVLALIETAAGLISALDVARAPRVERLGVGEADLAAELGLAPTDGREEFMSLRLQVVVASAAAGIGSPVGPASTDFRDLEALRRSTEAMLRIGFRGRTAIHPAQIAVINKVFSPTADEVSDARQLLASFEEAEREGSGVLTDRRGRMVDIAVVRSARDVLTRANHTE